MGLEYPFICVILQDRLNNDKWSAEPQFTRRLVNIILFPEQVSSALIRSLPELFESYKQHTKKINFPVCLLVLFKSCYPYSHKVIQLHQYKVMLQFCLVLQKLVKYNF